ncbi:MAG: molybdopterin cofactor-binding domain-containing protein [Candidatus Dormibacteraceae bacterium]
MGRVQHGFSRRDFLKGGGALVVGLAVVPAALRQGTTSALAATTVISPAPTDPAQLDTWLAVQADGSVVARCGHVELGQGNRTALMQIVAEELDVPFDKVEMVLGNTNQTYDQGGTYGSTTIRLSGVELRQVAAEGRAALFQLASTNLGVPVSQLSAKNGAVSGGGRTVSYGSLVAGRQLTAIAPMTVTTKRGTVEVVAGSAKPKSPSRYTTVGKSPQRVDIPGKVTGEFTYLVDVKLPNMLHARVVHPTGMGSTVQAIGTFQKPIPGAQVVQIGNLVAVVAEREWDAIKGAKTLEIEWSDWNGLPPSDNVWSAMRKMPTVDKVELQRGDVSSALAGSGNSFGATYLTPFEDHGTLGPNCGLADVHADGTVTVYSATQYPQGLQASLALMLGIPKADVTIERYEGPGMYGRMGETDDAASEAVLLSQKLGRPVRVQWMRADEHIWEPHSPGTIHDMRAALDSGGKITAWEHVAWVPPTFNGVELGGAFAGLPVPSKETSVGSWTGPDLYNFPNALELVHGLSELAAGQTPYGQMGLRNTFMRSPAQYQITYAQEAFVDEIAYQAKVDTCQFRLQHLTDPRAIAVLKAAAKAAHWKTRPSPKKGASPSRGKASGRGIAFVLRDGTYAACVLEAEVTPSTGAIQVTNVYVAQDSGQVINPSNVRHQIESCVIQTMSRCLREELTFDTSNVTSTNWATYPILTMAETPLNIVPILIDHPEISPTGVGEPAVNLIAPALTSAVFDATGVRIRKLPLRPGNVTDAMGTTVYNPSS